MATYCSSKETLQKLKREPQFVDAIFKAKSDRTKMEEEPTMLVPDPEKEEQSFIIEQPAAPAPANDVLAQFAVPAVPSAPAAPAMPQPAAPAPTNDVLAQFAVPVAPSAPASQQPAAPKPINDVLAQFAVPAVPSAPAEPHPAAPQPINDVFAQFALPSAPAPAAPQPQQNDLLAQFAMPKPASDESQIMSSPEDILAQFSGSQPAVSDIPAADGVPSVDAEIDELRTLAANAFAKPERPVST